MSPNKLPLILDSQVVFDEHFQIEKSRLQVPEMTPYPYYTVVTAAPLAVMVLATTPEGLYVLNWEYRLPTRQTLLSCPGGTIDPGEQPLACATRELIEETGYQARHFSLMGESFPLPGICTQKTIYVRATEAYNGGTPRREATEFIVETVLLSKEALHAMIRSGAPIDGLLLTALGWATVMAS